MHGFKAATPIKRNDAKKTQSAELATGIEDQNQGATPNISRSAETYRSSIESGEFSLNLFWWDAG